MNLALQAGPIVCGSYHAASNTIAYWFMRQWRLSDLPAKKTVHGDLANLFECGLQGFVEGDKEEYVCSHREEKWVHSGVV